jgi:hypothetical protein
MDQKIVDHAGSDAVGWRGMTLGQEVPHRTIEQLGDRAHHRIEALDEATHHGHAFYPRGAQDLEHGIASVSQRLFDQQRDTGSQQRDRQLSMKRGWHRNDGGITPQASQLSRGLRTKRTSYRLGQVQPRIHHLNELRAPALGHHSGV